MIPRWLWWSTLILLLLRNQVTASKEISEESKEHEEEILTEEVQDINATRALTAAELDVPECKTNYDCVMHGLCLKDREGKGRCLCPRSCSALVPLECRMASPRKSSFQLYNVSPCLVMGEFYTERFDMPEPYCHVDRGQDKGRCVCPPMFDPVNHTKLPIRELLPTKCDKRDLKVLAIAHPAEEVYKGTDVTLYCCVNIDPANHIDANGVTFIQNDTVTREPSKHPFRETARSRAYDILMAPSCWELEIRNVQVQDSGNYMCMVTPASGFASVNHSVSLHVKEREKRHRSSYLRAKKLTIDRSYPPRMIQNLAITVNETAANVTWDIPDGNSIPNINATLWRRLGTKQFVWEKINISSPINITGLRAATPFTLAINISDGQIEPYPILEHFTTMDGKSNAPRPVSVRVGLNSGAAAGSTLNCEVEWRAPSNPNGRITKYYVRVQGNLRHPRPDGTLIPSDYPSSVDKKCANYDEAEIAANGINPIDFSGELHYCKYGPLKPNRNYTVTIWAENGAGMSTPLVFREQCLTHYAQPDHVEKPSSQLGVNTTTFNLNFNTKFDDMNGPISCYYIAVVPLPSNVSIDSLPDPHDMIVDSMSRAFSNNLAQGDRERKVFIAYIAESYKDLPAETIIGDDRTVAGYPPCNVQYLSRHKAEDRALRPGMKYTGYLIVRVDRSNPYGTMKPEEMIIKTGSRFARNVMMYDDEFDSESLAAAVGGQKAHRQMRQLHLNGPVYGFSGYFKPIFLSEDSGRNAVVTALLVMGSIVLFLIVCGFLAMFILQKRGILNDYCPLKLLKKENSDRILLRPSYKPIPVEDLCSEYTIRHRDSDFLFTQEYESLPSACHESSASMKKENLCKNRYNDIKAYDSTRVKLKKVGYDENSDYINANFINSWNNKKKFIAAQAPLENTVEDFWRMVLEQDCSIIVMVANLVEKSRIQCVKYWPDSDVGSQRYGRYRVSLVHSIYNAFYTVRTFDIYEDNSRTSPNRRASVGSASDIDSEYANVPSSRITGTKTERTMRRVYQYHFTNWSDYRAPECSTGLLRFLHILRDLDEYNNHTVLIHCSAGVGRTGTFIAIDGMLDQAEEEGKVDIYGFVSGLRKQRNLMVQSLEQYVFVYKAMAEWYLFGYTDLEQDDVEPHYRQLLDSPIRSRSYSSSNLRSVIRIDNHRPTLSGLDSEYQKLSQCVDAPPKISFGLRDENIMRNRPGSALPYDKNRVVLSPMLACTDYYNASEMKGYFYPFILAQDPVSEETAFDFWRMVDGKEVSTIVMLSPEDEWSSSEQYWPEDSQKEVVLQKTSNSSSNKFIIVLESKEKFNHYIVRKMHYRTSANREVRSVWQFCLTDWPEGPLVPASLKSIPDLIARVLERQSKQRQTGHILLHCRDGSFRSGLFCCLSLLLERLKAEQKVDVFQTVKTLQLCREKIITTLDQYDFCYRCVIDYHKRSCASLT